MAVHAEAIGFEAIWVPDRLVVPLQLDSRYPYNDTGVPHFKPETPVPDPWVMLTHLAGVTRTLKLGVGVYVLPLRNAFSTAKTIATAQDVSEGRLLFGVGTGWIREEYAAVGLPFDRRAARAEEMLAVMRSLWTGGPVKYDGEFLRFKAVQMSPPISRVPPIFWGGITPAAIRRAVRLADGCYGPPCTLGQNIRVRQEISQALQAAGRDPATFELWPRVSEPVDPSLFGRYRDAGFLRLVVKPPDNLVNSARMDWMSEVSAHTKSI